MKSYTSYGLKKARRKFQVPLKMQHFAIPLAFIIVCVFRNQRIAGLSLAEAAAGFLMAFLSVLPLFIWASQKEREPPAFQCFCAIHFPYYAYQILNSNSMYTGYPLATRLTTDAIVVVYLTVAICVYYHRKLNPEGAKPTPFLPYRIIPERTMTQFGFFLLFCWFGYTVAYRFGFLDFVNQMVRGSANIVHVVGTGTGMISTWILFRQLGERTLTSGQSVLLGTVVGLTLTVSFASTTLVYGMCNLVVCLVAYTQARAKVPWLLIGAGIGLLAFLNLGKGDTRNTFGNGSTLTISRIIDIYTYWIEASSRTLFGNQVVREQHDVLSRSNLIYVLARAVNQTPTTKPYLYGETYAIIPQLLVPRLIWSAKPNHHAATDRLGLYYGLTDRSALRNTTVGIGPIAEAWANFGWFGVVLSAACIGALMRAVAAACLSAHPSSLHSIGSVVWVGMSFQIEQTASSWLSALATTMVGLVVCLYPLSRPAIHPLLQRPQTLPAPA
ncbi:MAG TPA: hypothetical protein VG713_05375 [Pirellulales bacterium]|nr:hypothetical protein [Pirellulales bacterium]